VDLPVVPIVPILSEDIPQEHQLKLLSVEVEIGMCGLVVQFVAQRAIMCPGRGGGLHFWFPW
jgi:hypothetical protein